SKGWWMKETSSPRAAFRHPSTWAFTSWRSSPARTRVSVLPLRWTTPIDPRVNDHATAAHVSRCPGRLDRPVPRLGAVARAAASRRLARRAESAAARASAEWNPRGEALYLPMGEPADPRLLRRGRDP